MKQTRKQYTKSFKEDAVRLVTEQKYSCAAAARSLGLNANMLSRWIQEFKQEDDTAFRGHGRMTPEQEELQRLRAENKRLKMEREILVKATAFFAKESS
jgi:transposase